MPAAAAAGLPKLPAARKCLQNKMSLGHCHWPTLPTTACLPGPHQMPKPPWRGMQNENGNAHSVCVSVVCAEREEGDRECPPCEGRERGKNERQSCVQGEGMCVRVTVVLQPSRP